MDKLRVGEVEKRRKRRLILLAVAAVVIIAVSVGITWIPPALPSLDAPSLFTGDRKSVV